MIQKSIKKSDKIKVLIAENKADSQAMLAKKLEGWGYDVICENNGKQALQYLSKNDINMAILSWKLPEMNGPDICKEIRSHKKELYTYMILLTSKTQQQDVILGLTAGADDYIKKPYDDHELKARLQTGERIVKLESKLLETQKKLQKLATRDSLTKLWNRRAILHILKEEIVRFKRENTILGTIMIDIDNFKNINDKHGHQVGDQVLVKVSQLLKKKLRLYDNIGRYGGDELLAVIPNCNGETLRMIASRLKQSLEAKKIKVPGMDFFITISMGGTTSQGLENYNHEKFISESDHALLKAKRKGRNCLVIFEKDSMEKERGN